MRWLSLFTMMVAGVTAAAAQSRGATIARMPDSLEARFALSALPPLIRPHATVYLLDPAKGYRLAQQGTSGVACVVQRTAWESAEYRDDVYVPRCYDAEGARTFLKVLMDAEAFRAAGMAPAALKAEIEDRYRTGRYAAPVMAGVSYMLGPLMRTWLDDNKVRTVSGPHVMFYAPNITDRDIGAIPTTPALYPFVVEEGLPQQSYMLQMLGEKERAKIRADEHELIADLCSYRAVLCLPANSSFRFRHTRRNGEMSENGETGV